MQDPTIIVALDYCNLADALAFADSVDPKLCRLKVGKELFTYCGPSVVRELHARGFELFLDLKFHDIPNTCAKAVQAAASLGVWMVNVHASGGERMLLAAREALADFGAQRPLLTAVTVLTSMEQSDLLGIGITASSKEQVLRLATLAKNCGLDGVVCASHEATFLKAQLGAAFSLVVPGIRPLGDAGGDQRRIMTPLEAKIAGADHLVIGRPITQAADPAKKLQEIYQSLL
ncbi:MAG: orotidine-5'-phosphate decarboxylase [Vibrionaceae bacterium]